MHFFVRILTIQKVFFVSYGRDLNPKSFDIKTELNGFSFIYLFVSVCFKGDLKQKNLLMEINIIVE